MDHKELAERIEKRLDRIDEKLDDHLSIVSRHEADLKWVRGYIKTSITSIVTLTIGVILTFVRTLKGE